MDQILSHHNNENIQQYNNTMTKYKKRITEIRITKHAYIKLEYPLIRKFIFTQGNHDLHFKI